MSAELIIGNGIKMDDGGERDGETALSGWSPDWGQRTLLPHVTIGTGAISLARVEELKGLEPSCARPTRPVWKRRHNRQPPRTTTDNR